MQLDVTLLEPDCPAALSRVDTLIAGPDWQHARDCLHERSFDGRWAAGMVAALSPQGPIAVMPISSCHTSRIPDANLRMELDERAPQVAAGTDPRRMLFLGGHAHLRGGVSTSSKAPPAMRHAAAGALIRAGLQMAQARSLVPVALFVPESQLPAVVEAWTPQPLILPGPPIAYLPVTGGQSLEGFVKTMRRSVRQRWRGDQQRLGAAEMTAVPAEITPRLLAEAAPHVANVKLRNGVLDHPRLTGIRLRAWLDGIDPGRTRAWVIRDRDAGLLGISVGVVHGVDLRMVEIGLVEEHPMRRDIYLELAFHAPLRTCLEESLCGIDFGPGHLGPKSGRGAVLRPQWHVFSSSVCDDG